MDFADFDDLRSFYFQSSVFKLESSCCFFFSFFFKQIEQLQIPRHGGHAQSGSFKALRASSLYLEQKNIVLHACRLWYVRQGCPFTTLQIYSDSLWLSPGQNFQSKQQAHKNKRNKRFCHSNFIGNGEASNGLFFDIW